MPLHRAEGPYRVGEVPIVSPALVADPVRQTTLGRHGRSKYDRARYDLTRSKMNSTPNSTLADPQQIIADLRRPLAERDRALARETATAETLPHLNASPPDLASGSEAISESAHNLCGGSNGLLMPMGVADRTKRSCAAVPLARREVLRLAILAMIAAPSLSHGATVSAVTAPIEQFYAALIAVMKAGKSAPFRQRFDALSPVIERTFDLDAILTGSVGPRWATLPPQLQSALKDAFRRYTIAAYVDNFDNFSGQRFEVHPDTTASGNDQIVRTRIVPASDEAHILDYVMRQAGGTWKVVDVLADGSISRVAVQRSEMRALLAQGGGPALVDRLQTKIAELSGGSLP